MNQIIFMKFQDFCAEEIDGDSSKDTFSTRAHWVQIFLERTEKK